MQRLNRIFWGAGLRVFGLLLLSLTVFSPTAFAAGTWTPLAHTAPGSIGLMLLLSDGTVIAQRSSTSATWHRLTPDIHGSYVNGTWTTLAPMHDTRLYFSSDILKDGRLFVAGGEYGTGKKTGEVYDPLTDSWTMTPVSGQSFSDSISKIIANGNVLVAPVGPSSSGFTTIYNAALNTWSTGPKLFRGSYQDEASWVKLPDDSILTIDPFGTNSERYIPSLNKWVNDANLPVRLYDSYGSELGGALLLPDGRAFFLGATGHTVYYTPTGTTNAGTWTAGPDIPNGSGTPDAAAAMMVNGKILCAVSPAPTSADHFPSPTSFYEFDYVSNVFTLVNAPTGATENNPTYYTTMLDLPDGNVLFSHFSSQLYVYQPDGTPLAAGKPTISGITQNADGTFHLTGTGLNGISEGAVYGDDWQMDSNYPIIRLTDGSNNVRYARTMNWSTTSVMTSNTPVSTEFILPTGLAQGTYSLVVVANGISSDPVSFDVAPITFSLPANATEGAAPVSATVNLPTAPASDLVVNLASSLTSRATVPSSVTVLAGQTSTVFSVTIVNDAVLNGSQATLLSATASNYQSGATYFVVKDNEAATLGITPSSGLVSSGFYGGPFSPGSLVYTLTNSGNIAFGWSAAKTASWLTLSSSSGTIQPGTSVNVTATINSTANSLAIGSYSDTIIFDNTTSGGGNTSRSVDLTINGSPTMSVTVATLNSSGFVGGPFSPSSEVLSISNSGAGTLNWTVSKTASWLTLSASGGSIAVGDPATVLTVSINSSATNLAKGSYSDTLWFTNTVSNVGNIGRAVTLGVNIPQLAVTSSDTNIVLQWPANAAAFSLQASTDLGTLANWNTVTPGPVVVSGTNIVTNSVSGMQRFFRLFH